MRLIDADKLKCLIPKSEHTFFKIFSRMIDEQPTVFDKDKVLSSLTEKMNKAYKLDKENDSEYFEGEADAFYRAIQIVEKGGLE